jgi:hypothetical protein
MRGPRGISTTKTKKRMTHTRPRITLNTTKHLLKELVGMTCDNTGQDRNTRQKNSGDHNSNSSIFLRKSQHQGDHSRKTPNTTHTITQQDSIMDSANLIHTSPILKLKFRIRRRTPVLNRRRSLISSMMRHLLTTNQVVKDSISTLVAITQISINNTRHNP